MIIGTRKEMFDESKTSCDQNANPSEHHLDVIISPTTYIDMIDFDLPKS